MSQAENNDIIAFCGASEATAPNYMTIFKSKDRSVAAHLDNHHNPNWHAHLKKNSDDDLDPDAAENESQLPDINSSQDASNWQCGHCTLINDKGYTRCGGCELPRRAASLAPAAPVLSSSSSSETSRRQPFPAWQSSSQSSHSSTRHSTDTQSNSSSDVEIDMDDDRNFYAAFPGMVHNFCDQVLQGFDLSTLRTTIQEADGYLQRRRQQGERNIPLRSNLANRTNYQHNQEEGRTPLCYAVAVCSEKTVRALVENLGADPTKVMTGRGGGGGGGGGRKGGGGGGGGGGGSDHTSTTTTTTTTTTTALTVAVMNEKKDCTEMVRLLLSLGSCPEEVDEILQDKQQKLKYMNRTMRYWLKHAKNTGQIDPAMMENNRKCPPMHKLHEIHYAVVGQKPAIASIEECMAARFGNPAGNKTPLVLLLLGPPGHGKTYLSRNMAKSLVGEDNFIEIAMGNIRDDANLFGRGGSRECEGQLTSWLRERQGQNNIVFLDEFEKVKELTSDIGWDQSKKIYQSFLEPWQEGTLTDQGANAHRGNGSGGGGRGGRGGGRGANSNKIDCSKTVWILTSNWGQEAIVDFAEANKERVYKRMDERDESWLQTELVEKILRPFVLQELRGVHKDIQALERRITQIVPFLPFTTRQQKVVADTALRERETLYREPAVLNGPDEGRRIIGNLHLQHTKRFGDYAAEKYEPLRGASSMISIASQVDGKFLVAIQKKRLSMSEAQRTRLLSAVPVDEEDVPEPHVWVHYNDDVKNISLHTVRPLEEETKEKDSDSEEEQDAMAPVEEEMGHGMDWDMLSADSSGKSYGQSSGEADDESSWQSRGGGGGSGASKKKKVKNPF